MSNDILRWFGVIKKSSGKFIFTSIPVSEAPFQIAFLRNVMKVERGDTLIELLQSSSWQPKDFAHYCNYHYLKEKEVVASIPQYRK